ncbi:MAG TPA: hypothetical protein VHX64_03745 [Caulobacteraceae bacterium]|jgi:hypothetical protein|nr:hypothetical protein [Caulobacteraceae bacterium]
MRLLSLLALAALGVAGCSQGVRPPADTGVCWHMSQFAGGKVRFNRVTQNVPTLEACAAQLEAVRIRFSALGSNPEQTIGAYQGQFLFLQPEGIFTGDTLDGPHYPFLVRSPDGRLVRPGTLPQQ